MSRMSLVAGALLTACFAAACGSSATVTAYAYSRSAAPVLSSEKTVTPDGKLSQALRDSHWIDDLDWSVSPSAVYADAQDKRAKLVKVRGQLESFKRALETANPWQLAEPSLTARALHALLAEQARPFNACYFGDVARGDIVWPADAESNETGAPSPSNKEPAEPPLASSPVRTSTGLLVAQDEDGDYVVTSESKQQLLLDWSVRARSSTTRMKSSARRAAYGIGNAEPAALELLHRAATRCVEEYHLVDALVTSLDAYLNHQQRPLITLQVLNALEEPIIVLPIASGSGELSFQRIELHDGFASKVSVPVPIAPKQYAEITFQALDAATTADPFKMRLGYLRPGRKGLEQRTVWLETPDSKSATVSEQ